MVDAIVLAGGKPEAFDDQQAAAKGLLLLAGKPMVEHVLDALAKSQQVDRRIIVVPPDAGNGTWADKADRVVRLSETAIGNLVGAIKASGAKGKALVLSADIPLVTTEAIDDFLRSCQEVDADIYYPIIPREVAEGRFPETRRTYMKLRDGTFTGGNIHLVDVDAVLKNQEAGERVFARRKSPVKLLRLLGLTFVVKFFLRRLTVADLERKASAILSSRVVAVRSDFPEIGVDVDKPDDWQLAKRLLEQASTG